MRTLPWVRKDLIAQIRSDLWRYLTPAASIEAELLQAAALLQISPRELRILGRLQFLVSDELGELLSQLRFLVRRLATTTASEEEWSEDRIRGAIQWSQTIGARRATGIPHLYVTAPARRAYQTPENELLALLLDAVVTLGRESGWRRSESADVGRLISSRVEAAERWLQTRALLEVDRRPMSPRKLARVRSGRHRRRYQAVLDAYGRYRVLAEQLDRAAIREAVETYGLISRDDATLFELVCTFAVIRALGELGWQLERLSLFKGSLLLRGRRGSEKLELSYQGTPRSLRRDSRYRDALWAHNIHPRPLRPDLVLTRTSRHSVSRLLVEAKGGRRDITESARAATFDLLAYRTTYSRALDQQDAFFGLGIVWGADLRPSETNEISLCTPDTVKVALARFAA
jgi:hypothetical protein